MVALADSEMVIMQVKVPRKTAEKFDTGKVVSFYEVENVMYEEDDDWTEYTEENHQAYLEAMEDLKKGEVFGEEDLLKLIAEKERENVHV